MLFNSFIFLFIFLPVVLAGYFLLGRMGQTRGAALWLTLASFFFYGWWNPRYLPLLSISIVVNYAVGVGINRARRGGAGPSAKALLSLGVVLNLAALSYYKYANFFIETCRHVLNVPWPATDILLPLAISFFTFTQIAYLVDAYHGVTEEYDFLWYCFFVSFFPHLIAGPIVSYRRLMPQFARSLTYRFQAENVAAGLSMFTLGLAKKVLIADNLSPISGAVFDTPGLVPQLVPAWVGALGYTFQLYFDFSAYSDMAIGVARMFNVQFPLNFNSPYKARTIADFWRRWHMTLSHFLRDHLYIPLGGNRHGEISRCRNLMVTMLLGGLWHGAGWNFVVWGGLHGIYLVIGHEWERIAQKRGWARSQWAAGSGWVLTFLAVVIGWVVFRAHSLGQAATVLAGMLGAHGVGLPPNVAPVFARLGAPVPGLFASWYISTAALPFLVLAAGLAFFAPNTDQIFRLAERYTDRGSAGNGARLWQTTRLWALGTGALLTVCILNLSSGSEFLYFKF